MRNEIRVWLMVALLSVAHLTMKIGFGMGPIAPDLLTVSLLLGARELGMGRAAGMGLLFGLLEDAMNALSFGANSVAMALVGILGAVTRDLFVGDSLLFLVSYFVLGKWVRDLVFWIMMGDALRPPFVEAVLFEGLVAGLYAAVVGIALMALTGLWREQPV